MVKCLENFGAMGIGLLVGDASPAEGRPLPRHMPGLAKKRGGLFGSNQR